MSAIAVALHDVEPATFERCALIRDWLADCGVDRCTLLVIPAPDSHPFYQRRPELADWLLERVAAGDAVAQHGFRHHRGSAARGRLTGRADRSAEFPGLKPEETVAGVEAGQRTLALAGLDPRGFVAPAYAYTPALRAVVRERFDWWSTLVRVRGNGARFAPAVGLRDGSPLQRTLSPAAVRAGALAASELLRLDLHPADLERPGNVRALEWVLRRSAHRTAVTYDDLA